MSNQAGSRLPVEPLRPWLAQAMLEIGESNGKNHREHTGYSLLARRYAERYGGPPQSAERMLHRFMNGEAKHITHYTADAWLTLLNLHLDLVYPEGAA